MQDVIHMILMFHIDIFHVWFFNLSICNNVTDFTKIKTNLHWLQLFIHFGLPEKLAEIVLHFFLKKRYTDGCEQQKNSGINR